MTLYYAHPKSMYGTLDEGLALATIAEQFPDQDIENPNSRKHQEGYDGQGMDYFLKICYECDIVVFQNFPGEWTGAGVAAEVETFADRGLPIYIWDGTHIKEAGPIKPDRILDVPATRKYLTLATEFPNIQKLIEDNIGQFNNEILNGHNFFSWIRCNWLLWKEFETRALQIAATGRSRYSARTIIESIRWSSDLKDITSFWKINNNRSTADLARLFHLVHPDKTIFHHRTSAKRS